MLSFTKQTGGLCLLLSLSLMACDSGDQSSGGGSSAVAALELVGTWTNNYGSTETVSETTWDNGYSALSIASYDNDDNWVVVQSPPDDEYTPNQYSKYVWTEEEAGVVYYCTVSFGLATLEEAEASEDTSDPSALTTDGCGGFAWTQLTAFELVGTWTNNYDGTETVSETTWDNGYSALSIASYDNDDNWVVVQSPPDDEYTPNQYSKYVWTEEEAGVVYYCTVSFGLATLEEAEASEDTSDPSALTTDGCNGFAWTELTAAQ